MSSALDIILPLCSGLGTLAIAGMYKRISNLLKVAHAVEAQTRNNGGSSMRDAIDRMEDRLERIERRQKKIGKRVTRVEENQSA